LYLYEFLLRLDDAMGVLFCGMIAAFPAQSFLKDILRVITRVSQLKL